jgi:hypothetical protein
MKRFVVLLIAVLIASVLVFAGSKEKSKDEDKKPTIVVSNGFFSGSMSNDGNGRSVLIVNTQTGDFEVFDIDRQGMERKTNEIYYSAIKYNKSQGTRQIIKYKVAPEAAAGDESLNPEQ